MTREDQKKETWINNVIRIQNISREAAELLYLKIFNEVNNTRR